MGCSCKKKKEIEDKYGVEEEKTILGEVNRFIWKVVFFIMMLCIAVVVIPFTIIAAIYTMAFSKNKTIYLPKFLGKYLNG
jgi:hypothetical protein